MGAPITEFMLERLIITGLEQVRNQPSKLDMIYEHLNEGIFAPIYGKKVIDQIKEYITNRKITVIQGLHLVPDSAPCYSIILHGSNEDSGRSFFDDFNNKVEVPLRPTTIIDLVVQSYDAASGFISVLDGVDLSLVYIGALIFDANDVAFEVLGPIINENGKKGFYIVPGATFVVGNARITDQITEESSGRYSIPILDNVQIGVHAADNTNLTKYLYYLLVYFLSSRRIELENAGYQIHRFNASDFIREENLLPDNITSRYVSIQMLTFFSWRSDPWEVLKDSQNKILVEQDIWEKNDTSFIGTTLD